MTDRQEQAPLRTVHCMVRNGDELFQALVKMGVEQSVAQRQVQEARIHAGIAVISPHGLVTIVEPYKHLPSSVKAMGHIFGYLLGDAPQTIITGQTIQGEDILMMCWRKGRGNAFEVELARQRRKVQFLHGLIAKAIAALASHKPIDAVKVLVKYTDEVK